MPGECPPPGKITQRNEALLAAWVHDSPGFYRNFGKELPADGDWTFIARALQAAAVYE
ncbi:DUF7660 family protein [Streptomyces rochei]